MDIDSYCLPDWPSSPNQLISSSLKSHQSKSAKSPRHVPISPKRDSPINEFLQPSERELILRTLSARRPRKIFILKKKKEI